MIQEILIVGPLQCNCSILGDETSREAIVVDPGDNIDRILSTLARHQLTVKQIVITHAHIDHIAGAQKLKRATGAPILYNQLDLPLVAMMEVQAGWLGIDTPEVSPPDDDLTDNLPITINGLSAITLHTPGHTQGSICLWMPAERKLVAGDTLFRDGIGRTDLPGGDGRQILDSIHGQLLGLPGDTEVFPGHGAPTTIGREKTSNYFLQRLS